MDHARPSVREAELAELLRRRQTVPEAAAIMEIAASSGWTYLGRLKAKTGTYTIEDVVTWAREHRECCLAPGTS